MNKKIILSLFTLIVLILFISYSFEKNKITYSAPTQEQVNEFIFKNSINALTIKETSDFSIILFENKAEYGHYVLYQDQNNRLYNGEVKANGNSKENPVLLGGVASGKIPFADGTVVNEEISSKGIIVLYKNEKNEKPMTYIKLVIYDKHSLA